MRDALEVFPVVRHEGEVVVNRRGRDQHVLHAG